MFVVFLTLAAAGVVSFTETVRRYAIDGSFPHFWMRAFWIGAAAAVPTALLVSGPIRKVADWLCK